MEKFPLPIAEDDSDRKLLSDIARVGWHLVGIPEYDEGPSYVFSVGLFHSFDQPEILLVGLDIPTAGRLVNTVGEQMQEGTIFKDADLVDGIIDGFPMAFRRVTEEYYRQYLGYALWFYESLDFPVLQCLWPDKQSRFPSDSNCDPGCRECQRLVPPGG